MINDIITEHRERMLNLKKYYPFFKLIEVSFGQFQDGKYEMLDMGYIVMAVLRFFIEENNFHEKDVTYPAYLEFISELLRRDFNLTLTPEEYKEIADYIFDKLKNDGKPFAFTYFDPVEKKKRVSRMKIIDGTIRNHTVWYTITSDAIEFYLDTKEIKDESRISVQQLLLEKMIQAQDFVGGAQVVARINEEVTRLQLRKDEVAHMLTSDVFAGIEAYEDFVNTGMRWFSEEDRLFRKNRELIAGALAKMSGQAADTQRYHQTVREIYDLENQLKLAMSRHGQLLKTCTDMQKMADDAIRRGKLGRLKSHTNFSSLLMDLIRKDNADVLVSMFTPMFQPCINKQFDIAMLSDALTARKINYEQAEKVAEEETKEIIFADEVEEKRIANNYHFLMKNLLAALQTKEHFTLTEFGEQMSRLYTPDILKNADYYSFFVNLCQKKEYRVGTQQKNENFIDDILKDVMQESNPIAFQVQMGMEDDEEIAFVRV